MEALQNISVSGIFVIVLIAALARFAQVVRGRQNGAKASRADQPDSRPISSMRHAEQGAVMADQLARVDRRSEDTATELNALVHVVSDLATYQDRARHELNRLTHLVADLASHQERTWQAIDELAAATRSLHNHEPTNSLVAISKERA